MTASVPMKILLIWMKYEVLLWWFVVVLWWFCGDSKYFDFLFVKCPTNWQ